MGKSTISMAILYVYQRVIQHFRTHRARATGSEANWEQCWGGTPKKPMPVPTMMLVKNSKHFWIELGKPPWPFMIYSTSCCIYLGIGQN